MLARTDRALLDRIMGGVVINEYMERVETPIRIKVWLVRYPFPPRTRLARIRQILKDDSFTRVKLWLSR